MAEHNEFAVVEGTVKNKAPEKTVLQINRKTNIL